MERRNIDGYRGETIDIRATLQRVDAAAQRHHWQRDEFFPAPEVPLVGLRRVAQIAKRTAPAKRVYISTGIHGDEPAGPLAVLRLLEENLLPDDVDFWICPCLNPIGFTVNSRLTRHGVDLNRDYLEPTTAQTKAHIEWLKAQPSFDLSLLLHEDWESRGFYLYEQNPDGQSSPAERIIERVATVCPIEDSETIEGRAASNGIIRPTADPRTRPQWPEAVFMIVHKTRLSYTIEAPSEFALPVRVAALVTAVQTAVRAIATQ